MFLFAAPGIGTFICSCELEDFFCDIVLTGTVAFNYGLNEVFRDILIVGKKLFGVLGQAVPAVSERRIVILIAYARVKADAFMISPVERFLVSA